MYFGWIASISVRDSGAAPELVLTHLLLTRVDQSGWSGVEEKDTVGNRHKDFNGSKLWVLPAICLGRNHQFATTDSLLTFSADFF